MSQLENDEQRVGWLSMEIAYGSSLQIAKDKKGWLEDFCSCLRPELHAMLYEERTKLLPRDIAKLMPSPKVSP